jgi:ABC-type Fe3+-citrate transport system substrate-binding protein
MDAWNSQIISVKAIQELIIKNQEMENEINELKEIVTKIQEQLSKNK